jgi:hypothetical protein
MSKTQNKAVRIHRSRLRKQGMKRVEVVVRNPDAATVRDLATVLRRDDDAASTLRSMVRAAVGPRTEPSVAEVISSLPDVSGSEFDDAFEEIERLRRHPIMQQTRDVEL